MVQPCLTSHNLVPPLLCQVNSGFHFTWNKDGVMCVWTNYHIPTCEKNVTMMLWPKKSPCPHHASAWINPSSTVELKRALLKKELKKRHRKEHAFLLRRSHFICITAGSSAMPVFSAHASELFISGLLRLLCRSCVSIRVKISWNTGLTPGIKKMSRILGHSWNVW